MFRSLKKLFADDRYRLRRTRQRTLFSPKPLHVSDLGFADLKDNYRIRTAHFDSYEAKLRDANPRLLHWIGSVCYSGYIRERSLRYLITNYKTGDENRILLRLEDWVPVIQALAERWVKQRFCSLSNQQIHTNEHLLLYLVRKECLKDSDGIAHIKACLLRKTKDLNGTAFHALDASFRRLHYTIGLPNHPKLRQWILQDLNPNNRRLLLQLIDFSELTPHELDALRTDKSTMVRKAYVHAFAQYDVPPPEDELRILIFDRNQTVRAFASYYLSKCYHAESYELYKTQTDDRFYYIADFAKPADLDLFFKGMRSSNNRIKYLCLKAICIIDTDALRQLNLKQLILTHRRLRKLILQHLPSLVSLEELKTYRPVLEQATTSGTLIYLHLLWRRSFWHFLDASLDLIVEAPTPEHIGFLVRQFYHKTYIYEALPPALKHSLLQKLDALSSTSHSRLQGLVRHIRFAVEQRRVDELRD